MTPFAQVLLMPTLFNMNPVTSLLGRSERMKTSVPTSSGAVEYAVDDSFGTTWWNCCSKCSAIDGNSVRVDWRKKTIIERRE